MVEPEAHRLECYRLEAGAYVILVQGEGDTVLVHSDWLDLSISLTEPWR